MLQLILVVALASRAYGGSYGGKDIGRDRHDYGGEYGRDYDGERGRDYGGERGRDYGGERGHDYGDKDSNCPIGCPPGWSQGPMLEHCYLMPTQPLKLGTFWQQHEYCKSKEPTAYIGVVNDVAEQIIGTAVVLQYAPSYLLKLTNAFPWLGGYVMDGKWVMVDGSRLESNGIFGIATKLAGAQNGSCLAADPKTLGVWLPRRCDDPNGAVVCEMEKRRVCGPQGGGPPIGGIGNPLDLFSGGFGLSLPIAGQIG